MIPAGSMELPGRLSEVVMQPPKPSGVPLTTTQEVTSEELATGARSGDQAAFTRLVNRHGPGLLRYVTLRVGGEHRAEEIVQESFLRAWRALDRFDESQRFAPWLYTIASRLATSHLRRGKHPAVSDEALVHKAVMMDPARDLLMEERRLGIWDLARRILSPGQLSALWMRYGEDMTNKEIALALDKSTVTVRVLLFRARQRLEEQLEPEQIEVGQ